MLPMISTATLPYEKYFYSYCYHCYFCFRDRWSTKHLAFHLPHLFPTKKPYRGFHQRLRWKFFSWPYYWVDPAFSFWFLDVLHTHVRTTLFTQLCSRITPAENAVWPQRNGKNESFFTLGLVICYETEAFATRKKYLIVTNHSDFSETSGKNCRQTRQYIIYFHMGTRPLILQYCISMANKQPLSNTFRYTWDTFY